MGTLEGTAAFRPADAASKAAFETGSYQADGKTVKVSARLKPLALAASARLVRIFLLLATPIYIF